MVDAVPTKILANPDGGFYVCTLTGFPFNAGQAAVYNVDKNGVISLYHRGLTMLTDMAFDARTGDIYAMQFGNFGFSPSPGFVFGSGKVHRIQRGGGFSEVVAGNFGPGSGLALDKAGNVFVSSLFTGQLLKMNSPVCSNFDLSITADNDRLTLYSSIKYSLKITNRGTTNATNVRVFWLPPYKRFEGDAKPFAYQAAYASKGHYDSWHGYWTIESLAPGETATATFHLFVVNDKQDATQTAQVAACNQRAAFTSDGDNAFNKITFVTKANDNNAVKSKFSKNTEGVQPINISPNPANNDINVAILNPTENEWSLQLVNTIGQAVYRQKGQYSQTINIDLSKLQNGFYLMEYQTAGARHVEKVLIQH
jgi:hypothetical protein